MNLIGFNPNYPALHMTEALELIVAGDKRFNHDDVKSIINQAMILIEERSGSFTKYEFSKLDNLLNAVLKMYAKEKAMPLMTHAQIAKATKDHLEANWKHHNVSSGLSEKQVWRIGYLYADVYMDYFGRPTRKQFEDSHFDCLSEAVERFDLEREMWLASRP